MSSFDHPAVAKVAAALAEAGHSGADGIRILSGEARTAAEALGVPVGAIADGLGRIIGDVAPMIGGRVAELGS